MKSRGRDCGGEVHGVDHHRAEAVALRTNRLGDRGEVAALMRSQGAADVFDDDQAGFPALACKALEQLPETAQKVPERSPPSPAPEPASERS